MNVAKRRPVHQRRVALEQRLHKRRQLDDTIHRIGHTTPNTKRHALGESPRRLKQARLAQARPTLDEHHRADTRTDPFQMLFEAGQLRVSPTHRQRRYGWHGGYSILPATPSWLASGIVSLSHSDGGGSQVPPRSLHQVLSTQECSAWATAAKSPQQNVPPLPAIEGSKSVLANSRRVDPRHYAVRIATEAAQLLWGSRRIHGIPPGMFPAQLGNRDLDRLRHLNRGGVRSRRPVGHANQRLGRYRSTQRCTVDGCTPMLAADSITSAPVRSDHRLPGSSWRCFGAIKPDRCRDVRVWPSAGVLATRPGRAAAPAKRRPRRRKSG
jgi:hypothetical protein